MPFTICIFFYKKPFLKSSLVQEKFDLDAEVKKFRDMVEQASILYLN